MSAHPNTFVGMCLLFSLDFKFMTISKKSTEDASILNMHVHVIHNKSYNIYTYLGVNLQQTVFRIL
jgi:hypothetical protein